MGDRPTICAIVPPRYTLSGSRKNHRAPELSPVRSSAIYLRLGSNAERVKKRHRRPLLVRHRGRTMQMVVEGGATRERRDEQIPDGGEDRDEALQAPRRSGPASSIWLSQRQV